jgi:hypothetical protein
MLKLINIKKNDNVIEADYIPENDSLKAHVSLNIENKRETIENIEKYGGSYGRMAISGLKRILDEIQSGKRSTFPSERVVMWY